MGCFVCHQVMNSIVEVPSVGLSVWTIRTFINCTRGLLYIQVISSPHPFFITQLNHVNNHMVKVYS